MWVVVKGRGERANRDLLDGGFFLCSNLKSEAHRIARLGWHGGSAASEHASGSNSKGTGTGTLGTDLVRETVMKSRDSLRAMEGQVKEVMRRREDARQSKVSPRIFSSVAEYLKRLCEGILRVKASSKLQIIYLHFPPLFLCIEPPDSFAGASGFSCASRDTPSHTIALRGSTEAKRGRFDFGTRPSRLG